jgi:pyruvate-formate lyase-activating enzyme
MSEKYCAMPFKWAVFLQTGEQVICNPTWGTHPKLSGDTIVERFNSPEINAIRESVLDGSYSYCGDNCPYLKTYREGGSPRVFYPKEALQIEEYPSAVEMCEDDVCNLACPTCRNDFILESKQQRDSYDEVQEFSDKIKFLATTASGDPLYSKKSFEMLKNISRETYPQLMQIRMHTNGLLLMQKWEEIKHLAEDFILDLNISMDAARYDTYKVVRKGGSFDLFMRNLEFMNEKSVGNLTIWYCVHDLNFREIRECYDLVERTLTNHNVKYNFFNVEHWSQDDALFKRQKVDNLLHPYHAEYQELVTQFKNDLASEIQSGKIVHNL